VKAVTAWYTGRGWSVRSVEHLNCGYDLKATRGGKERFIEVKGTSGTRPDVFVSANELRGASLPEWRLAVVTRALADEPDPVVEFSGAQALEVAVATDYRVNLTGQEPLQ
jgi:hypothetical protein